jgi:hypothetical protein
MKIILSKTVFYVNDDAGVTARPAARQANSRKVGQDKVAERG